MPFTWESDRGSLSGCITRTPDGHFVLDRLARITAASGALRRYRGRDLRITGAVRPLLLDAFDVPRGTSMSSQTRVAPVPAPGC
jgi:hypothetical protein